MLGLGIDIARYKLSNSAFAFSDADAEAYYTVITAVNGGEIDSQSLYSLTQDQFKQAIDTAFLALKSASIYTKLYSWFPVLGGTDVTHAINAINLSSDLIYTGSPSHGAAGVVLNGTTQHIDAGIDPYSITGSRYNMHLSTWSKDVTNATMSAGSRIAATDGLWCRILTSTTLGGQITGVGTNGTVISPNEMITSSIIGNTLPTDRKVYENNTDLGIAGVASGANNTANIYFGAWNNNGSATSRTAGNWFSGTIGYGLTNSEIVSLYNAINNLNTTLGR